MLPMWDKTKESFGDGIQLLLELGKIQQLKNRLLYIFVSRSYSESVNTGGTQVQSESKKEEEYV